MTAESASATALLESLDPEQRQVAEHVSGPLVVLAGAGTGKTRALTHRIAYGVATGAFSVNHVLALTFTSKAAGEMRSRLRTLGVPGVQARTFHSAALRQLRYFWSSFAEGPFPELLSHKAGAVSQAMAEVGYDVERETVRDVSAEIEYAAVSLLGIDDYGRQAVGRELPEGIDAEGMVRVMRAYGDIKTRRRLLDFEDILLVLAGALATREDIAARVHEQYRHFVVDEFQDVSPLQYDLLMRWLGRRDSLCVVGDPAQTIYTFAGATDSFLLRLGSRLPGASRIALVRNYRSTEQIVDAANSVLNHTGRNPLVLRSTGRSGPEPRCTEYVDDQAEAEAVAAAIAAEISAGRRAADIAVLFRTNGQSQAFENALARRGISYVLRGGERFFARREVKEAIALLRASGASRGVGPLHEIVGDVLDAIGWAPVPPAGTGAVRERWESLNAIVDLARALQEGSELPVPLADFLSELADRQEHQFAPPVNGVTLASVHAAKGLEWESVHLVGLTEGLFPISYARTPAGVAEERRLFYVAITRARTELSLSWSTARQEGRQSRRSPSRFVSEMRGAAPRRVTSPMRAARRSAESPRCERCGRVLVQEAELRLRRCGDCPGQADEQVLTALLEWRRERAQALSVPPYMVLTTATVNAVAEVVPRTAEQLQRVPGIGSVKLEQFGAEIVELVRTRARGAVSDPSTRDGSGQNAGGRTADRDSR
ncbi:ATP-dependent DNA helicase UvrD2 [Brevibacterium daeguense]|uniref:DNA 3'-5' helicase n=1 Tax=Brevibacterium daeguense TaxID=909936 RepID=A0ABP8EJF5_9MICO|nr:ATP-dependent DNA helicase UvrD2 [Brevibacterium daeguense]